MLSREDKIIKAFETYCGSTGLSPATVGFKAHRDSKMYDRLKGGGSCHPTTYQKVMAWFQANAPKKNKLVKHRTN